MRTGVSPKRIVTGSSVIKLRLSTPSMHRPTNSRQCPALPRARSLAIWLLLSSHRPGCKHPLRCSAKICRMDSLTTGQQSNPYFFLRKEVIQPHLPIRLPCYDFTPVTRPAFGGSFLAVRSPTSGISDSHGVTGGVYKTRERIHRDMLIRDY